MRIASLLVLGLTALPLLPLGVCSAQMAAKPAATQKDLFPPVNPKFFDVASPSAADVDAFLTAIWGYDSNRSWKVEAIQKTPAPGVARVTIFVADKSQGNKLENVRFFVTPDGKHAIADSVFDFGPRPFDEKRAILAQRADGPTRGAANKNFEIVEFADMQCPHCKEAQTVMTSLESDFPQAHFVFQNFPLTEIHPFAAKAAAYGNCVAQTTGNDSFFVYLQDVFDHQEALTAEMGDQTLANAVTKAGATSAAIATCAASPAAQAKVAAQIQLANDLGVDQTPMLAINGHLVPLGMPYETLKQVVSWDLKQSSVAAK